MGLASNSLFQKFFLNRAILRFLRIGGAGDGGDREGIPNKVND
jgi:hypothetical protein